MEATRIRGWFDARLRHFAARWWQFSGGQGATAAEERELHYEWIDGGVGWFGESEANGGGGLDTVEGLRRELEMKNKRIK
jgi:hypothetical protein